MLVYTTQSLNKPFFAEQKRKMAPQAKKNKGYGTQRAEKFYGSIIPVIWGSGEGSPKVPKNPLFFFFFPPKKRFS